MIRALVVLLLLVGPVVAEEQVVAGLSQNRIGITANFDGSEILIFGAVKREKPAPSADGPLEVIITVAGPSLPVTVRRKAKRWGIWVNTDAVEVDLAPSFYAVATSAPFEQVLSNVEDLRYKVSIPRAIRSVGALMPRISPRWLFASGPITNFTRYAKIQSMSVRKRCSTHRLLCPPI